MDLNKENAGWLHLAGSSGADQKRVRSRAIYFQNIANDENDIYCPNFPDDEKDSLIVVVIQHS